MAMGKVDAGRFSLQYSYSCYCHVLQVISQQKLYMGFNLHGIMLKITLFGRIMS